MARFNGETFSGKLWEWAMTQIPRITATFSTVDRDDLAADLAVALLELRQKGGDSVRDWKAYIYRSLRHRAIRFVTNARRTKVLESTINETLPTSQPKTGLDLQPVYRRLNNRDRHLVKELSRCGGSLKELAQKLRVHRNTISRRLKKIRARCPGEIETAPFRSDPTSSFLRNQLLSIVQSPTTSTREALRANVMLDLLDGFTYDSIVRRRSTSRATIARWRLRFDTNAVAGLMTLHPGRKPSPGGVRLRKWFRELRQPTPTSVRKLGDRFRLGKSTVHDVVKPVRDGARSHRLRPSNT